MKLAKIGLILSVLVVMRYGMASTSGSHIRKRLNVLETKMSLDALEFREGIEKLSSSLTNRTCGCSRENTGAVSPTVKAPKRGTDDKEITQLVKGFRRGFYNEKKFIRQTLSEMSDKMKGDIKACEEANSDTLRTTQSKLDAIEQRLIEMLDNLEDKLSHVENEVKQQNVNIATENTDIKDTLSDMSDKMEGDIKANTDTLRTTKSKFDAVEKSMIEKLKNLEDWLSHVEDEVKQQHVNIATELTDIKVKQQIERLAFKRLKYMYLVSEGWKQHGNSCYKIVDKKATWQEAVDRCALMGSYLVEVDNQPEQDFIVSIMKENDIRSMWLGGSDGSMGEWEWNHSGKLVGKSYDAWDEGRPYSANPLYNCLLTDRFNFKWYDAMCNAAIAYLCETNIG